MKLNYVNVHIVYEYLFRTGKISHSIAKRVKNRKAAPSRLCFIERCHLANSKNRSFLTSFSRGFNKSDSKRHLFILKTPNTKISYDFLPASPRACKIDNLHFTEASKSNLSPPNLSSVRRETFIRFNLFHRKKNPIPLSLDNHTDISHDPTYNINRAHCRYRENGAWIIVRVAYYILVCKLDCRV